MTKLVNIFENYNNCKQKYGKELTDKMTTEGIQPKYLLAACRFYEENHCSIERLVLLFKDWNKYAYKNYPDIDVNRLSFEDFQRCTFNAKLNHCLPNTIIVTETAVLGRLNSVKDVRKIPIETSWCIKSKFKFDAYIRRGAELYAIYLPYESEPYNFNIALVINGEVIYYNSENYRQIETINNPQTNEHQIFQNKLPDEIIDYLYNIAANQTDKMLYNQQLNCCNTMKRNMKIIKITENQFKTILRESRRDLLLEATIEDIYAKYYSDIPKEEFESIITSDPTYDSNSPSKMGKYSKWLLKLYKQGKLKIEDLYKYRESLQAFHTYRNQLSKKDIMAYGDGNQLYDAVKQFIENPNQATSHSDAIRRIKQDVDKVYEDDEWLILIPKTEEAAKYYGKGTRWCTAANYNNMFKYYNQDGPLYINIDKDTNEKYQFHFESEQFMDSSDAPIVGIIADTIGLSDGAQEYYENIGKGFEINQEEHEDPDAEPEEETLWEGNGWRAIMYPDSDEATVYTPDNDYFSVDLYNSKLYDGNGQIIKDKPLCQVFIPEIISALYDVMSSIDAFYNLVFNTDIHVFSYSRAGNNKILQISASDKTGYYDAVLYKLNEDYSFTVLFDFAEQGFLLDKDGKSVIERYTNLDIINVVDAQTKKINLFDMSSNQFLFEENVEIFCGLWRPQNYVFGINDNVGIVQNVKTLNKFIIPPLQNLTMENFAVQENLAVVKFKENEGKYIYSVDKEKYIFTTPVPRINRIGYSLKDYTGLLTIDSNEKYFSISDGNNYDKLSTIYKKYGDAMTYNPDSNMPVVLNDGTVLTRTQFWKAEGVYDILKQNWSRYKN